jgi:hypothetical protein
MAVYRVAEYAGPSIAGHPAFIGPNLPGFIRGQQATSTTTTTAMTLSSGTRWVALDCDSGMLVAYGSSTASAPSMTSTTAQHIAPNVAPVFIQVQPYQQLFVAST